MNAQECLNMLREMRDCVFSTADAEGRPQSRVIDVMLVEGEALYFCTARGKHFYRELEQNPHVAVTGLNDKWQTVRLSGRAERLTDQKRWIDRIFAENPSMNDVYPGESRYILEPFRIRAGTLELFDLGVSPIHRESFAFGGEQVRQKGFFITDTCIGCGTCAAGCPQRCIDAGTPYVIRQENCLHCGRCFEACPVGAIRRLEAEDGSPAG